MATQSNPRQLDPRGPRFGALITTVLLSVGIVLALPGAANPSFDAGWWVVLVATALFAWGTLAGPSRHPYGVVFRTMVRPRLAPPDYLEDEAPPRFAQFVGLLVTGVGIVLHLAGVPYGLVAAASAAFIAAFLNAAFGLCLGCEAYNLLLRLRGSKSAA